MSLIKRSGASQRRQTLSRTNAIPTRRLDEAASRIGPRAVLVTIPASIFFAVNMFSAFIASGAEGTIQAAGPDIGHWEMKVDDCDSGQRREFFGVVLLSGNDKRLAVKLVQPVASEQIAVINAPGTGHADVFKASQCTTFMLDLHRGHSTYNGVWNMYGSLELDCRVEDDHVWGKVQIKNCH